MIDFLLDDAPLLVERPQTYEDLRTRPDFRAPLDHKAFALKRVLTDYEFPKEAPCGLKSCRQPHQRGYLVLTDGGGETNIGNKCGRTHFGNEVFSSARADWVRRRDREALVQRAKQIQANTPATLKVIQDLTFRPYGAKWAVRVKKVLESVIGVGLVESLRVASIRGDLAVTRARRRSEEEIQDAMAATRGLTRDQATYANEVVGHLLPMPWLSFDFHDRLMVRLSGPLRSFQTVVPEALASPRLKAEVKRFDDCDQIMQEADDAAADALRFLARDNLQLVAEWIPKHHDWATNALRDWIDNKEHAGLLSGSPK